MKRVYFLLIGCVFVTSGAWGALGWHARGVILAGYSVVLLLVLLPPALRTRERLNSGVSAQGTVVGAEQRVRRIRRSATRTHAAYYHPRVRFTTPDGRTVVFTSAFGSDSEPEMGYRLPVRYRADNPEQAEVDSSWVWMLPGALGLLGALGLFVAGVVLYLHQ